jgi:hypothetical protein
MFNHLLFQKKGFAKHGWRTFMVSRMGIEMSDEILIKRDLNIKKVMIDQCVTYVTTDWTKQPEKKKD